METLSPQAPTRWDVPFRGLKGRPKIIILSDRMDATYYAAFHYPLQYLQDRALLDFAVMSSAEVRKSVSRMEEAHRLVDHLIAREAPHAVIFSRTRLRTDTSYWKPFGLTASRRCTIATIICWTSLPTSAMACSPHMRITKWSNNEERALPLQIAYLLPRPIWPKP